MKKFVNVPVYFGGRLPGRCDLTFGENVVSMDAREDAEEIALPERAVVLPGFVDEHIHGAGGADVMDGTKEALAKIAETLVKEGTTSFVGATMTQSGDKILRALRAVRESGERPSQRGARLLGVHLEGPFISEKYAGAQPQNCIEPPSVSRFSVFEKESGGRIRIVTLAPEREGAEELVSYLSAHGIVASLGHTAASYGDMRRAVAAGARSVTHTFNAQTPFHHREVGATGGALLSDELCCELICDTVHVSVPAMQVLLRCKPRGKIALVTDAIRAKGLGDGESELGGQKVIVRGGEARLENGTLAGSVLKMNEAVRNFRREVRATFPRAVDAATIVPATNLGLERSIGSIRAGKRADFAVVNEDLEVLLTVVGGEVVYRARGLDL